MPALSIPQAVERYKMLTDFVKELLKPNADFGQIPGTNKPTLLKPGAEKLLTFFGLTKRFAVIEKVEDWRGVEHGEPFFYYLYRCALYNGDQLIAESDGSCNSFESKYRWRKGERKCPSCGAAAIIASKFGPGGWFCFEKKGGCKAKFDAGDPRIESQQVGRVPNPDIADQVNTLQKMAQKRALIAATLLAVNASEFFTQDVEDMAIEGEVIEGEVVRQPAEPRNPAPTKRKTAGRGDAPEDSKPGPRGLAGQIVALCVPLNIDLEGLAALIKEQFAIEVEDAEPVKAIGQLNAAQQQHLVNVLKARLENRTTA
jgi:hypothetical protein